MLGVRKVSYSSHVIQAAQSPPWPLLEDTVGQRPPVIPASSMNANWLRDLSLLLWVHTGSAQVEVDDGPTHRVSAGNGIWLPAGAGGRLSTDAGSVAFPYTVPPNTTPGAPADPMRFTVPDHWQDWLILHFVHGSTAHSIFGYSPASLGDLLGVSDVAPPKAPPAAWTPGDEPPMPAAAGAHVVARELRSNPALGHSIEEWAGLVACSVSTLRRGFRDTGLTFAQWRTLTRLAAGCEFLAAGYDIEQVAMQVGFSSRNGFTRAFGDHYGTTPSDYAAQTADPSRASSLRIATARGTGALARLLGQQAGLSAEPADTGHLPATHTSWHTNDSHVLTWIYRGEGYLRIGDASYPRREGDAIWIPAGVEHQAGNLADSIALPIGQLAPSDARITEPLRAHFPPGWNTYLLHRTIATRSALRPEGFDPRSILDLFGEQFAVQRARTVPMPTDARARAVATRFLKQMQAPPEAKLDSATHEAFWRETGMTFARWQHTARMRIASDLLDHGTKPGAVARRVGYVHLRSFSRAFSSFHGVPPSQYRRSVSGLPLDLTSG